MEHRLKHRWNLFILIFLCCWASLSAQVFPGDANNNGEVDHVDALYIGYAFGTTGPSRTGINYDFEEQSVPAFWDEIFPNGTNYAFADADGSGLIDVLDLLTIFLNYGQGTAFFPNEYLTGTLNIDPLLDLDGADIPGNLSENDEVSIPIHLGTLDIPVSDLNGIAFSIEYNDLYIDSVRVDFSDSFLDPNNAGDIFTLQDEKILGKKDIAVTRFGQHSVSGNGQVGVLKLIIEDDLVGLMPIGDDSVKVKINLKDIMAIDKEFEKIPIADDSLEIILYNPKYLVNTQEPSHDPFIHLYPNPTSHTFQVETSFAMYRAELFDALGQSVFAQHYESSYKISLDLAGRPNGVYWLNLQTSEGIFCRKVILRRE